MSDTVLPRILIVEDDQTFRETVCEVLRDEGYKVKGARSLGKATKRLSKHDFDLVFTDFNLGDHNGFEVLQVANQKPPNAKIVLMSSQADPDVVQQALDGGATRFMAKPFRLKELLKAVEDLLATTEDDSPAG